MSKQQQESPTRSAGRGQADDGFVLHASDLMTRDPRTARPSDTIQQVASVMIDVDAGIVPVVENGELLGVVTDRDIVCRLVVCGADTRAAQVRDAMSADVRCVTEDATLSEVMGVMSEHQVRRVPVVTEAGKLVGIISLADVVREAGIAHKPAIDAKLNHTLQDVSAEQRS